MWIQVVVFRLVTLKDTDSCPSVHLYKQHQLLSLEHSGSLINTYEMDEYS